MTAEESAPGKTRNAEAEIIYQIRRHRLIRGLTVEDLSELTGLAAPMLDTIESGNSKLLLDYAVLLSVALDLPDSYFVDLLHSRPPPKPAKSKSDREVALFLARLAKGTRNAHARAVLYSLIDGLPGSEDAFRLLKSNKRRRRTKAELRSPSADLR